MTLTEMLKTKRIKSLNSIISARKWGLTMRIMDKHSSLILVYQELWNTIREKVTELNQKFKVIERKKKKKLIYQENKWPEAVENDFWFAENRPGLLESRGSENYLIYVQFNHAIYFQCFLSRNILYSRK